MDEMIYRMVQDSTVRIETPELNLKGTGCLVAPGLVLTCDYVVGTKDNHSRTSRVICGGADYVARITDESNRLALLQLRDPPPAHQCIYLHDSIRPGDVLYSFGFSLKYSGGDSCRVECEGLSFNPTLIKFKGGQVQEGYGGSPLLNERTGGVCGIINLSHKHDAALGGRAIPVATVFSAFPRLRDLQLTYHRDDNHWLRLLGTAEEHDKSRRFAVALSFPGDCRLRVADIAEHLSQRFGRARVFYDKYHAAELARPDLDTYLQGIYEDNATLVVVFLCAQYEHKEWCGIEWRAIRDLVKRKRFNALMYVRLDDTPIAGLLSIDGYIDGRDLTAAQIAAHITDRFEMT